jgi:hypothetical protein
MSVIDEIIRDAMRKGNFENLPGAGKPLNLEDDANTPADQRLAYKMLRDNNFAPDWIMESKELDTLRGTLMTRVNRAISRHRTALDAASRSSTSDTARANDEANWRGEKAHLRDELIAFNRRVLSYNLKVPRGAAHKTLIDIDKVLQTW